MSKKYYIVGGIVLFVVLVALAMLFSVANSPSSDDNQQVPTQSQ